MVIKTSNLGYDCTLHIVNTNCKISDLLMIDLKYGMKFRHESTTINQLKDGAIKEGFKFEIIESKKSFDNSSLHEYFARFGNY